MAGKSKETTPLMRDLENNSAPIEMIYEDVQEFASMIYMSCSANVAATGFAGLTVVSNFVNIDAFVSRLDTTTEDLGSVFLVVAISSVIGCLAWPTCYKLLSAPITIIICLAALVIGAIGTAACYSTSLLYFWYFYNGLFQGCLSTGAFAMIAYVHKGDKKAGPWFTMRAIVFAMSGFVAVLMSSTITSLTVFYFIQAAVGLVVTGMNVYCQDYEYIEEAQRIKDTPEYTPEYMRTVALSVISLGCYVGTTSSITSYLEDYISAKDLVWSSWIEYVVLIYWAAIITGQLLAMFTQIHLSLSFLLQAHLVMTIISLVLSTFVLAFSNSEAYLWFALLTFGVLQGINEGIAFDVANRMIKPSPLSATITLLMINSSADGLPYLVSLLWSLTSSALFIVIPLCIAASLSIQLAGWFHTNKINNSAIL